MKHFGIFDTVEDAQDALNAGTLENDYVALVGGDLDYNSLSPEEPCHLGEWSDDGEGNYTFQILDAEASAWEFLLNIGQLVGVNYNGDQTDMDVQLQFDGVSWNMYFIPVGGDPSDGDSYSFTEGMPDTWSSSIMTDPDASSSPVTVGWDGTDTFEFSATQDYPLSMNTINPECSEEGPSE